MKTQWCANHKTGEIFSYNEYGAGEVEEESTTDFPRGTWLVDQDFLVTGLASEKDAEHWMSTWSPCRTCQTVRSGVPGDKCRWCEDILVENGSDLSKKDRVS